MNNNLLISVILPVYNTEKYVTESINSILNQTYQNIELICINDGSIDGSLEILKSFKDKVSIINNAKNLGIAESRNRGINLAKGDFIAFMDADDIWENTKLETQIKQFENNPSLDISFTYIKCFLSPDLSDEVKKIRFCPPEPMLGYMPATAVIKTESFKKVGMFEPKWKVGEFIDWFNKAKETGLVYEIINHPYLLRRIHETNTGVTDRDSRSDYLKIVREALARKKGVIK